MHIKYPFFTALFTFFIFSACQKQSPTITDPPVPDSVTVIKSSRSVNYDDKDKFDYSKREDYLYDTSGRKVTISIVDSSLYDLKKYAETFTYDKDGRIVLFESTTTSRINCNKIEFTYEANGNIKKALLYYVGGTKFENLFTYSTTNGTTKITMYDTSGTNGVNIDIRPRIVSYYFDAENRLIRQLEAATPSSYEKVRTLWFRDTTDFACSYTGNDVDRRINKYNYYDGQSNTPFFTDTTYFSRESTGVELYNSYLGIYRNVYWFSIAEKINNSFAETMVYTANYPHYFYFWKYPLKKITRINTYGQIKIGIYQNTFDSKGLLIHAVFPKGFANKYDGAMVIDYDYIKIKK